MKPTTEQSAILSAACGTSSNLLLNALAGTGKTSTLRMIERATGISPILYLVFNKKNAEEAKFDPSADDDAARMLPTTVVQTLNACGHRVWSKTITAGITLDAKKTSNLLRQLIKELPKAHQGEAWDVYHEVIAAIALAKAYGYVPEGAYRTATRLVSRSELSLHLDSSLDELGWQLLDQTLSLSIRTAYAGSLDFNDQLYMPALFGGTFPRFPLIMVDELQDLSPVNHAMLDKLATGRIIGVGDPWQSIYGFRGAKQAGMADAQTRFKMTPLDLSVSFRCPRAIVEAAHWRVPHFKWKKEGGLVASLSSLSGDSIPDDSTFICRNNAPLFRLAVACLSHSRSVSVSGSEIGPRLIGIMQKLGDPSISRSQTLAAINVWLEDKLSKDSKTADDLASCMRVFAEHSNSLAGAIATAEHVLAQRGSIQMMTGHKAKGLEFDRVYFLDPWLCREDEQDRNLRYVIQTRAKQSLFEIDSRGIKWT